MIASGAWRKSVFDMTIKEINEIYDFIVCYRCHDILPNDLSRLVTTRQGLRHETCIRCDKDHE